MWRSRKKELIATAAILLTWEACSRLLNLRFLPGAAASASALIILCEDGTIPVHFFASLYRIVLGSAIGLVIAVPVGLIIGRNRKLNDYLGTVLNILYPVPKVVFLPIIVVAMGIGDMPKIFLIALVLFFQMTVVIRDAAQNIHEELSRSMIALGANKIQYMYHLVFLGCLPDIMTALRGTIGVSTAMLFITENFASSRGLGYFITKCMNNRNYEEMYAGILALILLGLFIYGIVGFAERTVCRWKTLECNIKQSQEIG